MISDQEIRTMIKFYTNEALGITVAKIDWDKLYNIFRQNYFRLNEKSFLHYYFQDMLNIFAKKKNLYKGLTAKASCNYEDGDEWDEKIGKMIAEDRLMVKLSILLGDFCSFILDEVYKFEHEAIVIYSKCEFNRVHYEDNLKNLNLKI